MKVTIEKLSLSYGDNVVVNDLDLEIADGESLVLLGQSGCGKTSTMRCVAGLEMPATGRILIGDTVVHDSATGRSVPPNKRNVGMVFQSYAVWPHRTVFENVAFALQMQKMAKDKIKSRVHETLDLVGLRKLANRGASLLSGGQMQRVALARSLVMHPDVLLLDEPLSNLDARLREHLRMELRELQLRLGLTTIYVTHDQVEAFALADRIAVMQDGRIVQCGSPHDIYTAPVSGSVAEFLGLTNLFPCTAMPEAPGCVKLVDYDFVVDVDSPLPAHDTRLVVCLRPEDLIVTRITDRAPSGRHWAGKIAVASYQGASIRYRIALNDGPEVEVLSGGQASRGIAVGTRVTVTVPPGGAQVVTDDRLELAGSHA